ncbi:MAG: type II toxin-antitoxin system VapC family toxin [Pseudomonadota bacterium]
MSIVIDCSIWLAASLGENDRPEANKIIEQINNQHLDAVVPQLFYIESANVIVNKVRKEQFSPSHGLELLQQLHLLPVELDDDINLFSASETAMEYRITVCDAVYLQTAIKHNTKLASLDGKLAKAAEKAGRLFNGQVAPLRAVSKI